MNRGPQLAVGARGRDVQRVQTIFVMMKTLGFDKIDGVFGTLTRNAVVAFQEGEGLLADGVVGDSIGPRTWWAPAGAAGATLASLAGLTTV
jgi:peptidoglycan hydrolase-like protein with peptidoglycan-binding domain